MKKIEWSKLMCGLIILYGMANGALYHVEMFMAMRPNNVMGIVPDSSLAIQCVITILGGIMSYLLYNFGLKSNRNKYGIDAEGNPFNIQMQ